MSIAINPELNMAPIFIKLLAQFYNSKNYFMTKKNKIKSTSLLNLITSLFTLKVDHYFLFIYIIYIFVYIIFHVHRFLTLLILK